jgi:hypothetical protein
MPIRIRSATANRITNSKCLLSSLPGAPPIRGKLNFELRLSGCSAALRVYTKSGCPLCDGLVDKLHNAQRKGAFLGGFWAVTTIKVNVDTVSQTAVGLKRFLCSISKIGISVDDATSDTLWTGIVTSMETPPLTNNIARLFALAHRYITQRDQTRACGIPCPLCLFLEFE